MIAPRIFQQLAACVAPLPNLATAPALARETVYMPSSVAALVLGTASRETARASRDQTAQQERPASH